MAVVITPEMDRDDLYRLYLENIDYQSGTGNVSRAENLQVILPVLAAFSPQAVTHGGRGGEELRFDAGRFREQLGEVRSWLRAYYRTGYKRYYELSEYRS